MTPLNSLLVSIRQPEAHLKKCFPHYVSAKVNYKLFKVGGSLEAKKKKTNKKYCELNRTRKKKLLREGFSSLPFSKINI